MGGTVLIIDDEESIGRLVKRLLDRKGYDVIISDNPLTALETFRAEAARIVSVLLDLRMPQMRGEDVMRELQKIKPGIPIIVMSGYRLQDLDEALDEDLYFAFLQKPFDLSTLYNTLAQALA